MALKGFFNSIRGRGEGSEAARAKGAGGLENHFQPIEPEAKLALIEEIESTGLGWFWATDADGNITYLSPSIAALVVPESRAVLGESITSLLVAEDSNSGSKRSLPLVLGSRKPFSNFRVSATDPKCEAVLRLAGKPIFDSSGEFRGFRGSGADITEEYRNEVETSRLAKYDSLTGLSNRHRMSQQIDSTLAAFAQAKRCCALMMLDLDRFKQVNDMLGHAAGDELLKQVAQRLERVLDSRCEIGRLGGDEFQVMLPDIDDRGELGEIAKKIIMMLSQPYSVEEGRCVIGASVGVAIAPYDGVSREELVRAADLALYAAKNGGRGQFRFYSTDLESDAHLRKAIEADLKEALAENQMQLEYQPVMTTADNRVVSLEAQMVWIHPERGAVPPQQFLPVAEENRQIIALGEWALKQACRDAASWPETLRVSVNISSVQFASEGFIDAVAAALEESGLEPTRLELEFKETVFLGEPAATDKTLAKLFKLGVRLSLDEFGTGFSSLEYLRRAPFDTLKIGENFLGGAKDGDGQDHSLLAAIVALASALGMRTVAVGAETLEMVEDLKKNGVTHVQGSIFASPVGAEEIQRELEKGDWTIKPAGPRSKRSERRTVLRRINVIHEDHSYEVMLRNLSRTGAMIQGLLDVPVGTQFVVDFGHGQLAVATVKRSAGDSQGLAFETPLVDDGAGGLCTRHRVSPYALAAAGAPLAALPPGRHELEAGGEGQAGSFPQFAYANPAAAQGGTQKG